MRRARVILKATIASGGPGVLQRSHPAPLWHFHARYDILNPKKSLKTCKILKNHQKSPKITQNHLK